MSIEIEVLRRALEIISDPVKWTQGTFARDQYGNSVAPDSPEACRWCALGAIDRAAKDIGVAEGVSSGSRDRLVVAAGGPIPPINDTDGHAVILAAFDKAIASEVTP